MLRAVVALAESGAAEERLRLAALETLGELRELDFFWFRSFWFRLLFRGLIEVGLDWIGLDGMIVIRDVDLLVRVEGLRVVLQTLADGPHDFSPFLAMAFLAVFDRPGTRGWLRGGIDIEVRQDFFVVF